MCICATRLHSTVDRRIYPSRREIYFSLEHTSCGASFSLFTDARMIHITLFFFFAFFLPIVFSSTLMVFHFYMLYVLAARITYIVLHTTFRFMFCGWSRVSTPNPNCARAREQLFVDRAALKQKKNCSSFFACVCVCDAVSDVLYLTSINHL